MVEGKKTKLLKEICDIDREQEHIQKLIVEGNMQKLNNYLEGELTRKYFVEKFIYNMSNFRMPDTVQESANNALIFLNGLKREKEAELAKNISSSDE